MSEPAPEPDRRRRDTRDRMVKAAVARYRAQGMTGTGFSEILADTGAARGAIYHHFPGGKDELTVAVIDRYGTQIARNLDQLLAAMPPGQALGTMCSFYADKLEETQLRDACPIAPVVLEVGLTSDPIASAADIAFTGWRRVIAEALVAHGRAEADARSLAETAVAAIEGALILVRARRDTAPLRTVGTVLASLLDG